MAASDALQHKQLAMFMTPKQIQAEYHPHPGDMDVDVDDYSGSYSSGPNYGSPGSVSRSGPGPGMRTLSKDELWERKTDEAYENYDYDGGNLIDSVEKSGIQRPIPLYHGSYPGLAEKQFVANGQHRVAAAAQVNADRANWHPEKADIEVPVIHHGDTEHGGKLHSLQQATWASAADRGFGGANYRGGTDYYARPPRT
jgi:hypothetical protein